MTQAEGDPFIRNAKVLSVYDGDTVTLDVDLGYFSHQVVPHRLLGINAPELHHEGGAAARDYLRSLVPPGTEVVVHSRKVSEPIKADKYGGRFLADLRRKSDDLHINQDMIDNGFAKPYDGKGTKPV